MYQVVITEPDGQVHGKTFKDPLEAIKEFGRYFVDPKFDRKGQIMFQELGQLVVVLDDYRLTYAEVLKASKDLKVSAISKDLYVNFHSSSTKEDFIEQYKRYIKEKTWETGALIDLKSQQMVLAFNEGKVYEL